MKYLGQYLLLFFISSCWACYEDKGNYDYTQVNHMDLMFTPETNEGSGYVYRQPLADTLEVAYRPIVSQTLLENENNLEYRWRVVGKVGSNKIDTTIGTKELTLKYPPKVKSQYNILFRVHDNVTDIDLYAKLNMHTELPFINSWFILHGGPDDRKVACIEYPNDKSAVRITPDLYENLYDTRRFLKAEKLIYNNLDDQYFPDNWEQLTVIEPDSLYFLIVPQYNVCKVYEDMIPNVSFYHPKMVDGFAQENGNFSMLLTEEHKLYYSAGRGLYKELPVPAGLGDYQADRVFISQGAYATIWDEENRQFSYIYLRRGTLMNFPVTVYNKEEWKNKKILWLGRGVNDDAAKYGASVIAKEGSTYEMYHIGYELTSTVPVAMTKVNMDPIDVDENSCFASTKAFSDQLFYSSGSKVYLLNMVSGDSRVIYDAGAPVTKLKFRIVNESKDFSKGEERMLGVVVRKGAVGELHEIFMSESGDVSDVIVHTGFGPILDLCYSFVGRVII